MLKLKLQFHGTVSTDAETNLIKADQMAKVREVDFVQRFAHSGLAKLLEVLGVTRKIPCEEGTTMYMYTTSGTLENGNVPEGEIIPLSQISRDKVPIGNIILKKWRKASSAESIKKSGFNESVTVTDGKLLSLVQKGIRSDFFTHLNGIQGTVVGASTFQGVLAQSWARLQILFEDDTIEAVHFVNPLTVGDYLESATVTLHTAFGMSYIENFLGLGTVILTSGVPKGRVVSTAKENLIMYYITINGDLARAFGLTADETGYVGISSGYPNKERAQIESLVMSGIEFLVEYGDGVVQGQIDSTPSLQSITVTSTAGTAEGDSNIAMSGYSLGTGEKFVYKCGATAPSVNYGQKLTTGWKNITSDSDITPGANDAYITVAAVDAQNRAQAAGSDDLTVNT